VNISKPRRDYIAFLRHAQRQPSAAATTIVEQDRGSGHVTIVVPIGAADDRTTLGDVIDAALAAIEREVGDRATLLSGRVVTVEDQQDVQAASAQDLRAAIVQRVGDRPEAWLTRVTGVTGRP
jgi:hypothetical protein